MKYITVLVPLLLLTNILNAQLSDPKKLATTTTLPEGTMVTGGKIKVIAGYRAMFGPKDNKVLLIQRVSKYRAAKDVITGSFTCSCNTDGTDDCTVILNNEIASCVGTVCKECAFSVTIKPKAGLSLTRETKGEIWKRLILSEKRQ